MGKIKILLVDDHAVVRKGLISLLEDEENLEVVGDRDKIVQVLLNLLGNAIKFTPEAGRIWISFSRRGRHREELLVEVGDTGRGIARDHYELVFREFAQVRFS